MEQENFEKRPVTEPVLDSATRERISNPDANSEAGGGDFVNVGGGTFWAKNKWFVLILILSLAVIGLLVFLFTKNNNPKNFEPKVDFKIDAPAEVGSGSDGVIKFIIANGENKTISKPELEVVYPTGATFVESQPKSANLSGTVFELADLSPGANVTVFIKMKFESNVGEALRFSAKVKYQLSGLSARFENTASVEVGVSASGLSVNISGPNSASNGQPVSYTIRYANQTDQDFDRARIVVNLPPSFQTALSTPKPNVGSDTWDVADFTQGKSGEIKLDGSFSASGSEYLKITASLLLPNQSGSFLKLAENEFVTTIGSQPLQVSQEANLSKSGYVFPGDSVSYTVKYQNTATTAARGVRIVFSFDNNTIDQTSIQAEGAQVSGGEVIWSAASKQTLEVLSPNDGGTLVVRAKVKNPPVNDRTVNPDVKTSLKIISNEYENFLKGNDLSVKIASEPELSGVVDYVDGAKQLKVGVKTTFQLSLVLKNTTSDILDSELTAFLPPGVSFKADTLGQAEAGRISFDGSTGKLVWKVGVLRAYTGTFAPKRQLDFQVDLIPGGGQVDTTPDLLRSIKFTGLENFTQRNISLSIDDLNTGDYNKQSRVRP